MKTRRILCYIMILLFSFTAFAQNSAQNKEPSGIELCNAVHSFLKKNGFSPESQSLVISGENTFPYNIIVRFTAEQNTSPENLLLVFFQEDVPENQKLIKEALSSLRQAQYPFSITVLFAYGEKQPLEKADMIYGTKVFLDSINTNLSYTAAIFDLAGEKNSIQTTAKKLSSPPQLIRNSLNLFKSCGVNSQYPKIILSQLSSYSFISNRILDGFFEYDIPAIELCMGQIAKEEKNETIEKIITGFVELFSKSTETSWEHHFLIIKLFGSYHLISERNILHIVIPTIFIWLIFIFMLVFVNRRLKKHTWYTIGHVWWSVPLTFVLIILGFFIAGITWRNLFPNASFAGRIYGQLIFQICVSLFLCFSLYLIILTLNFSFDERAVDYLLVISCIINQSIFILADISLSPIFIAICLLSLLALTVKNNYLHIALFILMLLPLIPYGHRMISSANLKELSNFLATSKGILIFIPLVLYPVYIVLFRIITSVRSRKKQIRFIILSSAAAYLIITLSLTVLGIARTISLNKEQVEGPAISISPLGNELIDLSVSDKNIFDDIIRTVDVSLKKECLLCDILITTDSTAPVLYSDNDYTNPAVNTARFRIPNNPPDEMTFRYGAAKAPCRITVSAVIEAADGDYQFISRSLEIGETQ